MKRQCRSQFDGKSTPLVWIIFRFVSTFFKFSYSSFSQFFRSVRLYSTNHENHSNLVKTVFLYLAFFPISTGSSFYSDQLDYVCLWNFWSITYQNPSFNASTTVIFSLFSHKMTLRTKRVTEESRETQMACKPSRWPKLATLSNRFWYIAVDCYGRCRQSETLSHRVRHRLSTYDFDVSAVGCGVIALPTGGNRLVGSVGTYLYYDYTYVLFIAIHIRLTLSFVYLGVLKSIQSRFHRSLSINSSDDGIDSISLRFLCYIRMPIMSHKDCCVLKTDFTELLKWNNTWVDH